MSSGRQCLAIARGAEAGNGKVEGGRAERLTAGRPLGRFSPVADRLSLSPRVVGNASPTHFAAKHVTLISGPGRCQLVERDKPPKCLR